MTSSIAGVLDNILATLLVSIYNFLYKPDGMIDIFSQYNDIINNILEKKVLASTDFVAACTAASAIAGWNCFACNIISGVINGQNIRWRFFNK